MTTLTAKYAMVVPKEAQRDLDLRPGIKVDLEKNDRGEWVLVKVGSGAKRWVGRRPGPLRVAEEMAQLRGRGGIDFD